MEKNEFILNINFETKLPSSKILSFEGSEVSIKITESKSKLKIIEISNADNISQDDLVKIIKALVEYCNLFNINTVDFNTRNLSPNIINDIKVIMNLMSIKSK
jgi:hypothetical protein